MKRGDEGKEVAVGDLGRVDDGNEGVELLLALLPLRTTDELIVGRRVDLGEDVDRVGKVEGVDLRGSGRF